MAQIELRAEPRTVVGKHVRHLRREGWVPAVLYGPGSQPRALQIEAVEAETVARQAGMTRLISIHVAGQKAPVNAILRDMQRDVLRRNLIHFDLYEVEMTKAITVEVPIVLVGESPVVKRGDGILIEGTQSVEIECLPGDLIDSIEVNLANLATVDQQISVADLTVPATVRILSDPEEMVVRVNPLGAVVEEEVVEAVTTEAEPELVRKRKVEEVPEEK